MEALCFTTIFNTSPPPHTHYAPTHTDESEPDAKNLLSFTCGHHAIGKMYTNIFLKKKVFLIQKSGGAPRAVPGGFVNLENAMFMCIT